MGLLYRNKLTPKKRGEAGLLCNDKCWFPSRYLKWFDPVILLNHRQEMINVLLMRPLHFISHSASCRIALTPGAAAKLLKSTLTLSKSQQFRVQKKTSTHISYMLWEIVRKLKSNTQSHCSLNALLLKAPLICKKSYWNSTLSAFVDIKIIFIPRPFFISLSVSSLHLRGKHFVYLHMTKTRAEGAVNSMALIICCIEHVAERDEGSFLGADVEHHW